MTLQEKIDKLPLSIKYEGKVYNLQISIDNGNMILAYRRYGYNTLFHIEDYQMMLKTSSRLEELVDRALTIIENKEWEQL